jgi:hypothetical protein
MIDGGRALGNIFGCWGINLARPFEGMIIDSRAVGKSGRCHNTVVKNSLW